MAIYSAERVCPKCGHDQVSTVWCPGLDVIQQVVHKARRRGGLDEARWDVHPVCVEIDARERATQGRNPRVPPTFMETPKVGKVVLDEHLERRCGRCKYGWCEKPIDAAPPLVQLAAQAPDWNELNDNPK